MLAFEIDYLLGRAFAASVFDSSVPEWPPHPSRFFSAFASAFFENGEAPHEREALQFLETLPPPQLFAAEPGDPEPVTAFVPTNYPDAGDMLPVLRNKQPRTFAVQAPAESKAYVIWPDADPPPTLRASLDALSDRTVALGRACSFVQVKLCDTPPVPNYVPDPGGRHMLRVISSGRLEELQLLYKANRRPNPGTLLRYRRVHDAPSVETIGYGEFGHMLVLRRTSGVGLPVQSTLTVADAARNALIRITDGSGTLGTLFHGHDHERHCAVVALPFVGHEHADGHLLGIGIVMPRDLAAEERLFVLRACNLLASQGLHIPGVGPWQLEALQDEPSQTNLRAATWNRASRAWSTVTPVLLDRFPRKNKATVEDILCAACNRIGLPSPVAIQHAPYSPVDAVPPVPEFRLRRKTGEKPRWGVHATLTFDQLVRGPVLLGAGRFFGLGLLRPVQEGRAS